MVCGGSGAFRLDNFQLWDSRRAPEASLRLRWLDLKGHSPVARLLAGKPADRLPFPIGVSYPRRLVAPELRCAEVLDSPGGDVAAQSFGGYRCAGLLGRGSGADMFLHLCSRETRRGMRREDGGRSLVI